MNWQLADLKRPPEILKGISRIQSNTFSHPDNVFFREGLAYFSKTMLNHISDSIIRVSSTGLTCRLNLSPVKNFWHIVNHDICPISPRTAEQLQSYISEKWDDISPKGPATGLLSSRIFTDCCWKKRGCGAVVKMAPSQLFWDFVLPSHPIWAN